MRSKVCLDKPDIYEIVRHVLGGDGLFTSSGEHWRFHRKLLAPSLKETTVSQHLPTINYYARNLCETVLSGKAVTGEVFDVLGPLNICLLEMYLHAIFGTEWQHKTEYSRLFQS